MGLLFQLKNFSLYGFLIHFFLYFFAMRRCGCFFKTAREAMRRLLRFYICVVVVVGGGGGLLESGRGRCRSCEGVFFLFLIVFVVGVCVSFLGGE